MLLSVLSHALASMHSCLVFSVAVFLLLEAVTAFPFPGVLIERQEDLRSSYDYVVVGGGTAGLTIANRLSEDEHRSVLVIEAGSLLPEKQDDITIPGLSASLGFKYQWGFKSQPITTLKDNGTFIVPSAKVVGGDSTINSMSYHRGSREDYDNWERMGNKGWGWEGMIPYFKKCETFHPPDKSQIREFGITYDPTAHGTDGPVQVKFSSFIYPQYKTIADAFKRVGVPIPRDSSNGNAIGALWIPATIDPKDETRSYVRTAYHDVSVQRNNYHLIVEQQVTKILVDKNKRATGVEFSKGPKDTPNTISAKREVILSAGAFHNPKLLQLSGIGPKSLLEAHNIPVIVDLPGVGSNLQDHAWVRPFNYTSDPNPNTPYIDPTPALTNATYQAEQLAQYRNNLTGYYVRPLAGSMVAYLPLPIIGPDSYESIISASRKRAASVYLQQHSSPAVLAGFKKQKSILLNSFSTGNVAVAEISIRPGIQPGPALILQKPLSRGYVEIASKNPFDNPLVYFRTLSDPTDVAIVTQTMRYIRRFFVSKGMASFKAVETYPGTDVVSDEALAEVARGRINNPSVGHASCTCPMMEREIGGVVDDKLRVYGVTGLRIVDISVMPIIPSCHLVSTRYAIAEKAADIIRGRKVQGA
ncbi:hypothetical protein FPQ18DRAFT_86058 [Pyronema domesticum]|nr:hypothetical protein FPQ18DRAFT_86058 [Pyronema domesticum]